MDTAPRFTGGQEPTNHAIVHAWFELFESLGPRVAFRADPATGESWVEEAGQRIELLVRELGLDILISLPGEEASGA
jgi:hypothetical protein